MTVCQWRIIVGDGRETARNLEPGRYHCAVTSPPYWALRNYEDHPGQLGSEPTPEEYVAALVEYLRPVREALRDDGVLWLNLGDTYASNGRCGGGSPVDERKPEYGRKGHASDKYGGRPNAAKIKKRVPQGLKAKDLVGIPWRVALALQADGWWLRCENIWWKPDVMPESAADRPTRDHEHVFMLTKRARYFYDADAVKEPLKTEPHAPGNNKVDESRNDAGRMSQVWGDESGRNLRTVWRITKQGYSGAHFATFPEALPIRCIKAATSEKGCCPECGAPVRRVVDRTRVATRNVVAPKTDETEMANRDAARHVTDVRTIGWKAGCNCGAVSVDDDGRTVVGAVPCRVLDPFNGAGTTGVAAIGLMRDYTGLELVPGYAEMAAERIRASTPLWASGEVVDGSQAGVAV